MALGRNRHPASACCWRMIPRVAPGGMLSENRCTRFRIMCLGLDDDVGILHMYRECFGDIGSLGHSLSKLRAAFDRNGKRANLESLRIEPGLAVAHVELP